MEALAVTPVSDLELWPSSSLLLVPVAEGGHRLGRVVKSGHSRWLDVII